MYPWFCLHGHGPGFASMDSSPAPGTNYHGLVSTTDSCPPRIGVHQGFESTTDSTTDLSPPQIRVHPGFMSPTDFIWVQLFTGFGQESTVQQIRVHHGFVSTMDSGPPRIRVHHGFEPTMDLSPIEYDL